MTKLATSPIFDADTLALDFSSLRKQGVALLQCLAGDTWTDFNTHDPGITILEQLCYALTDLGYRTSYDLPDLLTCDGEEPGASLYTPAQVLPTSPVTLADLRMLVIDVPGVKNAWVEIVDEPMAILDARQGDVSAIPGTSATEAPSPSSNITELHIKGLLRVQIEKSSTSSIDGSVLRREVARRIHQCRGLGQDFHEITVLDSQPVGLAAVLEIDALADVTSLLARVYQSIADYMSPSLPFRTLDEMRERRQWVDEIFEGPLLERGFIDPQDLAEMPRQTSLRISDLIHVIMAVPGIVVVKNLFFQVDKDKSPHGWLLNLDTNRTPRFESLHLLRPNPAAKQHPS